MSKSLWYFWKKKKSNLSRKCLEIAIGWQVQCTLQFGASPCFQPQETCCQTQCPPYWMEWSQASLQPCKGGKVRNQIFCVKLNVLREAFASCDLGERLWGGGGQELGWGPVSCTKTLYPSLTGTMQHISSGPSQWNTSPTPTASNSWTAPRPSATRWRA